MDRRRDLSAVGGGIAAVSAGYLSVIDPRPTPSIGERDPTPYTDGRTAWPGDGFDPSNTGYNPDASLLTEDLDSSRITDDRAVIATDLGGGVAVAEDRLYFGTRFGDVVSYTAEGASRWTYEADSHPGVRSVPSLAREAVYVSTENGTYALAAADGEELWTNNSWIRWGSSAVVDGTVYAISSGPAVVARDAETGERKWQAEDRPTHSLAVDGDEVCTAGNGSDGG